jgi:nitrogen PTS system EIIA component
MLRRLETLKAKSTFAGSGRASAGIARAGTVERNVHVAVSQNRNRIMELEDLVRPEGVIAHLKVTSKKQALQELSERAAKLTGLSERAIFETLLERERLGSTGVGQGIAIPHGKLGEIDRLYGLFARLDTPIDFESVDDQPVDLIFLLLAPETAGADHLKALARISRLLRNQAVVEKLRASEDAAALFAILTEPAATNAACGLFPKRKSPALVTSAGLLRS